MRTVSFILALLCAAPASAAPFTWVVQGHFLTVSSVGSGVYENLFSVGQSYTLTLSMESTAIDRDPNPNCGNYMPLQSIAFTSGNVSHFTYLGGTGQSYAIGTGRSPFDCGLVGGGGIIRSDFAQPLLNTPLAFDLEFYALGATDALPVDPIGVRGRLLSLFSHRNTDPLVFLNPFASANIESVTRVPEPASSTLVAFGLLGEAWRRVRRRKR